MCVCTTRKNHLTLLLNCAITCMLQPDSQPLTSLKAGSWLQGFTMAHFPVISLLTHVCVSVELFSLESQPPHHLLSVYRTGGGGNQQSQQWPCRPEGEKGGQLFYSKRDGM